VQRAIIPNKLFQSMDTVAHPPRCGPPVGNMSAFQPISASPSTPAARAQALRLVRAMMGRTLGYFEDREDAQLTQIRSHLLDLADSKLPLLQSQNLRTAAMLLDRQAETFKRLYRDALQRNLQEEMLLAWPGMQALAPAAAQLGNAAPPPPDHALDGMTLSLIDVDEVHRILLLDRVAQQFNQRYEVTLAPLTLKLGALFGVETATLSGNPFRPEVLLRAFQQAWERGEFEPQATDHLVEALEPSHTINLGPLYTELDAMLTQAGIRAEVVHRIRKSVSSAYAPLSAHAPLADAGSSGAAPLGSGMAPLQGHGGSGHPTPSGMQSAGGNPAGNTPSNGHHSGEGPGDGNRSTWGAMLPTGQQIAGQVRAFLHRLGLGAPASQQAQLAMEPPPAADPALMNYLGQLGQAQVGDANAGSQFQWLQAAQDPEQGHYNVLRQIRERDEIRRAPELDRGTVDALAEVFDYVFADEAIPMQMKVVIGRLQIPVLRAAMLDRDFFLRSEHPARKLVDSLASASVTWTPEKGEQDPLYVRIEHTVQRVLTEFESDLTLFSELLAEFTTFLFETEQQAEQHIAPVADQQRDDEALQAALAHADEVIHARISLLQEGLPLAPFLKPFLTTQWRQVIAAAWLTEDSEPGRWNASLRTMDQLIWSTQPKTQADERKALVTVLPELVRQLNIELDGIEWHGDPRATFTRRLIGTHMLAIRMKAPPVEDSQSAALEESAGQAAMEALDMRRAAQLSVHDFATQDTYDESAQLLSRGVWFEVALEADTPYRCRLSWVSPMRTRFLFTNREGFDAFVRSEREVAAMLRDGQLRMLEQAPIVERALHQLMADKSDNLHLQA
jgi:hypothetical protein